MLRSSIRTPSKWVRPLSASLSATVSRSATSVNKLVSTTTTRSLLHTSSRLSFAKASASSASSSSASSYTFKFPETTYETHNCPTPPLETTVSKDELLDIYRQMLVMRRMETASDQLYKQKMIRGFCHLCTGQEVYFILI